MVKHMSTATEMVALYLDAEKAILKGQTMEINGRRLTRANLAEVVTERAKWERRVTSENNRGRGHALASFYD